MKNQTGGNNASTDQQAPMDNPEVLFRKRLGEVLEGLTDGVILYDRNDCFVMCNEAYRQSFTEIIELLKPGTPVEAIVRAIVDRGIYADANEDPEVIIQARLEKFNNSSTPTEYRTTDGRWYLTSNNKSPSGETMVIHTDVTALKKAENTLLESEERFRRSQQYAHIGTWDRNLKTNEHFWAEGTALLFGYEEGKVEASLENFMAAVHPDDRERVSDAMEACTAGRSSYDEEFRVVWQDGSVHWLHERGNVVRSDEGEPLHFLGVVWDITQRKKAEEALRKLSRAVMQSPNAVFITDTKGTIEYVNRKFEELTGYSEEEAIGQNPRILKSEQTPRETYADLWGTINAGKEWRGEIMDKAKDGSHFWVSEIIAPVKNDEGEISHFVAIHEDITARKQTDLDLRRAVNQADVANRAKSELLANMSHELRTPLNAIIGFSDAMAQKIFGPLGNEKYEEYTDHISKSGQHLLDLINDILDVSAVEAGKLELHEEEVDVGSLVNSCIELVRHRAEAGDVYLSTEVSNKISALYVDERRMKQILLNLLSNAVKFTPEGGRVSLMVSIDSDSACNFSITDTGIGMDEADIARAMTQFGQVDSSLSRKQEGTGLGLPLTQGLVELHGGYMTIKSEHDKGTTVSVCLPASRLR